MNYEQLAFYLRGFAETAEAPPNMSQWGVIRHAIMSSSHSDVFLEVEGTMPEELKKALEEQCRGGKGLRDIE